MDSGLLINILVVFFLALAGLIWLLVKRARRLAAEKKQMMFELGFYELPEPDPTLLEKIEKFQHYKSGISIQKIFKSNRGDCRLYIAEYKSGSKNSNFNRVALFVSSHLDLPRISLMPKPKLSGFLGSIVNSVLMKIIKKSLKEVLFSHDPDFNLKLCIPPIGWVLTD